MTNPAKDSVKDPERTDVVIVGAGLVGAAMAIALAQQHIHVTLCERSPRAPLLNVTDDGRASAIARSSVRVYQHLGIWEDLLPHAEPINDIRVVDAYSTALVHYDHQQADGEPFGYIIPNAEIRPALIRCAEAMEGLEIRYEITVDHVEPSAGSSLVTFSDGKEMAASLVLAADGRFSTLREKMGIEARRIAYDQVAMVSTIEHSLPHHGLALERFLPAGPFALLPMKGNRCGVVWSEPEEVASQMMALSDTDYAQEIARRAGEYPGDISMVGKRFSYPLSLVLAKTYTAPRFALIGDSAHAIHPIAGQGVNLGYRDVAVLTDILVDAKRLGLDLGDAMLLERYEHMRQGDVVSMVAATDGINRLFSNNITPFRLARRLGLSMVERMPRLKHYFMFHAMGLTGHLPEMLKDSA